ncbi:hypothetical protein SAMN06273570_4659 [Candidatus Pantoea floridensis]|uniref:Uncharacterized protein n=1 Tax=Candidatus Pantoea floridensis TaxID=1938870 RepID=A0A286DNY6_9GAMM|nr:hypothetical protein BX596_4235 [Enterobacteriaceae bacterium JKS000233]SOD60323.1 hypothetical protein SAMN06273570_4659 [Pantoea floridensis]
MIMEILCAILHICIDKLTHQQGVFSGHATTCLGIYA